ncbi:DUF1905 domain-containing protein [Kineosporia succinea]|uniref:DUF1905 domain-containing protein n=1 Tax=Kineosporia succinea TaxID=84632 RepID=A0ABT9P834_9ACTN|nr:DUF1905 domain-containing protein [Kineosporia succinea]MDP9828868.1 hypothetical protein [Kineosporia succinea]
MDFRFEAELIEWRGPAPYYFLPIPPEMVDAVREVAADVTYGWGMVPVEATIGASSWETSLWPREGGYLLPVRKWVQKAQTMDVGETATVGMRVVSRGGRAANGTGPTM